MRRLLATIRTDASIQARHGFYVVSAILAPLLGWFLGLVPDAYVDLARILPAVMAFNLLITTFFFVGALVLLEKAQGSLRARVVSPLRPREILASKVLTLTLLGLVESLAVVAIAFGPAAIHVGVIAGGALLGALYVLLGIVTIVRYETFDAYILPAVGVTMVLLLPLLHVSGLAPSELWAVHPVLPALLLMQEPVGGTLAFAFVGSLGWILLAAWGARRVWIGATTVFGASATEPA